MQEYKVKRGHFKNIEGEKIREMIDDIFGKSKPEGDGYQTSFGAIKNLSVKLTDKPKAVVIDLDMDKSADDDTAAKTIKKWNEFLFKATGFTAKERRKKLQDEVKKNKK